MSQGEPAVDIADRVNMGYVGAQLLIGDDIAVRRHPDACPVRGQGVGIGQDAGRQENLPGGHLIFLMGQLVKKTHDLEPALCPRALRPGLVEDAHACILQLPLYKGRDVPVQAAQHGLAAHRHGDPGAEG